MILGSGCVCGSCVRGKGLGWHCRIRHAGPASKAWQRAPGKSAEHWRAPADKVSSIGPDAAAEDAHISLFCASSARCSYACMRG